MNYKLAMAAGGMLVLLGSTAACGSSSSSTASDAGSSASGATGAAAAPTSATSNDFCTTLEGLDGKTTPKEGAEKLEAVGTPSDTSTSERHGYEVFVDGVAKLPDDAKQKDFAKMEKNLSTSDATDVQAFVTYVTKECAQAPASPSTSEPTAPSS